MKDFGKKIVLWLIGIAVFVASVDVIVWLFDKFVFDKSYEFTFKWSIMLPIAFYFILTIGWWLFRKFKKKK